MTSRHLSEPEAWREIARELSESVLSDGLCNATAMLFDAHRISYKMYHAMRDRIDAHHRSMVTFSADGLGGVAGRYGSYAFRYSNRPARVIAALFLALEAEDELSLSSPLTNTEESLK